MYQPHTAASMGLSSEFSLIHSSLPLNRANVADMALHTNIVLLHLLRLEMKIPTGDVDSMVQLTHFSFSKFICFFFLGYTIAPFYFNVRQIYEITNVLKLIILPVSFCVSWLAVTDNL